MICRSPEQCHAPTRDYPLLHSSSGGVERIIHTILLLIHLHITRPTHLRGEREGERERECERRRVREEGEQERKGERKERIARLNPLNSLALHYCMKPCCTTTYFKSHTHHTLRTATPSESLASRSSSFSLS